MKKTYVIKLDSDVAEFIEQKTRGTGDANAYINQILGKEKQRQEQAHTTTRYRNPSRGGV